MILCISVLPVVTFSFLILLIWFFSLFPWWVWLVVCLLYLSSQRTSFWFVDFCYSLLCFFFIYFCSNFYDFFPSYQPWGSSFLLFLVASGVNLDCFFDLSLISCCKLVLLWNFPLAVLLLNPIGFELWCFHFHLFLCIFWFLLWFVGYSEACCLASICLYF